MNWSDERYVRLYTRDTPDWLFWSWQARALFPLLLRKVDRAGVIDLGQRGAKSVAILVGLPVEVVELGLAELLGDGCVAVTDNVLVIRNFIEAQETPQSDKARQRESRARRHADAERGVTKRDQTSQNVTENHESSRDVTDGHAASRDVTLAVPCRAVPAVPEKILAPVGASSGAKEPAPDARAPATDPVAPPPPPLTLDGAPPRRAARRRAGPPPDPVRLEAYRAWREEAIRILGLPPDTPPGREAAVYARQCGRWGRDGADGPARLRQALATWEGAARRPESLQAALSDSWLQGALRDSPLAVNAAWTDEGRAKEAACPPPF